MKIRKSIFLLIIIVVFFITIERFNFKICQELVNLQNNIAELEENLYEQQKTLEEELQNNEQSIHKLQVKINQTKQALTDLQTQYETTSEELSELRTRIDSLLTDLELAEEYSVTAYAPLDPNAIYGLDYTGNPNVTASGDTPRPGETVAAATNIPFGTRLWIEGVGVRTVNDRGGGIGNRKLDLCVETQKEALTFGRQKRKVIILD